uniref:ceramide synthase-like isoform X3 n=2 Tax=Doryrhamphus excisus TaxID=161450 RepID=UPI0025AE7E03|nr:ceramide synthase-like isoform X3 [Doryrhamphus excisus]
MLALMAAGGVFFPGLFLLSRLGLRVLMGWTEADATIVSVRGVSSLQAAMASAAGCVIASSCQDVMEDKHWLTEAYVSFAAPYFVYDVYAMFLCHRQRGGVQVATFVRREMLMVLHHAFMVLFCLPASLVTMATTLHSPANHRATVCVCVCAPGVEAGPRGLLPGRPVAGRAQHAVSLRPQLEKEHTLLYKVNGVLTLLVFFACRVALFPYLYLTYSRYASVSVGRAVLEAPWQCNLGAALLWPLQLYWMALMCRRALRLLTGRSHAKVKKTL